MTSTRDLKDFGSSEYSVAAEYGKALVHLRQQKHAKRFGLVFGAGLSKDLKLPMWSDLLQEISEHKDVNGADLLSKAKNLTSLSQLLFEHYKSKQAPIAQTYDADSTHHVVKRRWLSIVRECLYATAPKSGQEIDESHPYLWAYINLIKGNQITINYNFDDSLERLLEWKRDPHELDISRGFTAIWDSNVLNIPRGAVIYHPNGYLPYHEIDRGSDQLVFLEDSFGDQLIASMAGHYTALSAHFEQNTCLFIGLSLEDPTLKHMLRKSAHIRPGHFHYFVHWVNDKASLSNDYISAVVAANFETRITFRSTPSFLHWLAAYSNSIRCR